MYQVIVDKEAKKALKKLPKYEQERIIRKMETLAEEPRPEGVKALQGNWRGFYRIIYNVEDTILTICVVKIAHHRNSPDQLCHRDNCWDNPMSLCASATSSNLYSPLVL